MERKAEDMSNGIICSYLMRQINFIWERIAKQWLKNTDLSWYDRTFGRSGKL